MLEILLSTGTTFNCRKINEKFKSSQSHIVKSLIEIIIF